MPVLKYKDPADGLWKPVPVGGAAAAAPAAGAGLTGGVASYDVGAGAGIAVDADTVALDTAFTDARYVLAPLPAPPTIPAAGAGLSGGVASYEVGAGTGVTVAADTVALDTAYTDTLYSPVAHNHDVDYVNVTGDTMTGPLFTVPPTLVTHAGRWADGVGRFADAAARDAAYTGAPLIPGMMAWIDAPGSLHVYDGVGWRWVGPPSQAFATAPSGNIAGGYNRWTLDTLFRSTPDMTLEGGGLRIGKAGIYSVCYWSGLDVSVTNFSVAMTMGPGAPGSAMAGAGLRMNAAMAYFDIYRAAPATVVHADAGGVLYVDTYQDAAGPAIGAMIAVHKISELQ